MATILLTAPNNKVYGAYMGPTWGRQDPGGPHVGHTSLAIWGISNSIFLMKDFICYTGYQYIFWKPAAEIIIITLMCHEDVTT